MQLAAMATAAREAIGYQEVTARAARGDFKGAAFQQRAAMRITPLVPKPLTSGSKGDGRLDQRDFNYGADRIACRCPAGERAIWRMTTVERGQTLPRCWPSGGPRCLLRSQSTAADARRITRRADEAVSEVMQRRLDGNPDTSRMRRQTVEHPFATLEAWMGSPRLPTKTVPRVQPK